jgi:hypothetical protein
MTCRRFSPAHGNRTITHSSNRHSAEPKRAPEYPGRFLDDREAVTYFTQYFNWYDTEHYPSGIDSSPRSKPTTAKGRPSWMERLAKAFSQRREENQQNLIEKTQN